MDLEERKNRNKGAEELEREVFLSITRSGMIREGDTVIAGVSGGADSVCMLHLLSRFRQRLSFTISAVHVEHGLRGEEALEDAAFVRRLCGALKVPCRIVHVEAEKEAARRGIGIEEAGRALRYEAFDRIAAETAREDGGVKIAVAHNREDQAETVLFRLARGSALAGLRGMRPVNGNVIRPLLDVSRARIEEWLTCGEIPWRTDRTNQDDGYTRNRIRHRVLPALREGVNCRSAEHICEAAEEIGMAWDYLEKMAAEKLEECRRMAGDMPAPEPDMAPEAACRLHVPSLLRESEVIRRLILRGALSSLRGAGGLRDVGRVHFLELDALLEKPCGRQLSLPGCLTARRERDVLVITGAEEETPAGAGTGAREAPGRLPGTGAREAPGTLSGKAGADDGTQIGGDGLYLAGGIRFRVRFLTPERLREEGCDWTKEKKYTKWLSCDTIKEPVRLRRRKSGDYLVINAAGGRKKLKDYMIDRKIPREERDTLILAASGSRILWVPGHRISEDAKVTERTGNVLEITWLGPEGDGENGREIAD